MKCFCNALSYTSMKHDHSENGVTCRVCESLSLNNTTVAGNVVLCFTTVGSRSAMASASSAVRAAGGVGVIVARNPSNALAPCSNGFPCI